MTMKRRLIVTNKSATVKVLNGKRDEKRDFHKRNADITLRSSETTFAARARAFHKNYLDICEDCS